MGLQVIENAKSTCKGLFFRGKVNIYYDAGKFVEKRELRLLRKSSCIQQCQNDNAALCDYDWLLETLSEAIECEDYPCVGKIEDGRMYKLVCIGAGFDSHTGEWEPGELSFDLVK